MASQNLKAPNNWPILPVKAESFEWVGDPSSISWIVKNRKFIFISQSCLGGKPNLPHLLLCQTNSGKSRAERFRVVDYHFAGRGYLSRYGNNYEIDRNTVFVVVDIVRVKKNMYERLKQEGPNVPRGRRPDPVLHIDDFVSSTDEKAALTHWLQNPIADGNGNVPYSDIAMGLLPEDLCNMCSQMSVTNSAHPFAADFQMNSRLLAHDRHRFTFVDRRFSSCDATGRGTMYFRFRNRRRC